ncbi:MarR family transcriptional regulator [Desulfobotulus sp. H1]|uniref:MarR family transcriptional regulator n=1 Tax=Desulfobotulus pelophilus TaxID=2823377 RepID=A0ABT3N8S9_9BACT|nr:MarR family transcriptional regulator [Desulfobotulus pelophilus]MCW7753860.1 MarR family transcriptional regulator [Desulfobotulus pelophilus]
MDLAECLKVLQAHMWELWREAANRSGSGELTSSELYYLYALLGSSEGMRLTELAEVMRVSKASASAMAAKLESRGYLERWPCPEDRRASLLRVTVKSRGLEQEDDRVFRCMAKRIEDSLGQDEYRELSRLLVRVCAGLVCER